MKRLAVHRLRSLLACVGVSSATALNGPRRFNAAFAEGQTDTAKVEGEKQQKQESGQEHSKAEGQQEKGKTDDKTTALGAAETPKRRNIVVMSNTTKAVYIHPTNHIASWYWFVTDFHKWFIGIIFIFVGSQVLVRYRVSKANTAAQAQLGENLLDQRTRDLLSDIEVLRKKDPIRLEHEANVYHEQFWKRRAMSVANNRNEARKIEIERGKMQGLARGTDMTEWLGAKEKDDEEREVARRTQDYIQGFHQHLKSQRLI